MEHHQRGQTEYVGDERRVHRVYVTRNTEYHVRAKVCVAVRDRVQRTWFEAHPAVGRTLEGVLRISKSGISPCQGEPDLGDSIYFRRGERDLITSRVERIERPAKDIVKRYPAE